VPGGMLQVNGLGIEKHAVRKRRRLYAQAHQSKYPIAPGGINIPDSGGNGLRPVIFPIRLFCKEIDMVRIISPTVSGSFGIGA